MKKIIIGEPITISFAQKKEFPSVIESKKILPKELYQYQNIFF